VGSEPMIFPSNLKSDSALGRVGRVRLPRNDHGAPVMPEGISPRHEFSTSPLDLHHFWTFVDVILMHNLVHVAALEALRPA